MSGKEEYIRYTRDELIKLNVYGLRKIPDGDRYSALRKFVSDEESVNLSSVVKRPTIPAYLKNRYGDINMGTNVITKGNYHEQREVTRRKLYVQKNESIADSINEEIRDLLSKISDGNKEKLLSEFSKKNIPDECGQVLVDNIYMFAVDLSYLVNIYVDVILILKEKNVKLYNQLIDKIVNIACEPFALNDQLIKRLRLGNIALVSAIYCKNNSIINFSTVMKIINFLLKSISLDSQDYIQILCELLKNIIPTLKENDHLLLEPVIQQLDGIAYDHQYDKRYRFMTQDIVDSFYAEDDEDDK